MNIKLDKDYEVKCTLGTIRDIEVAFGKPFISVISGIDKLTTAEQVKLLYLGVKRADNTITEVDFTSECENNLGLGDFTEYLETYIMQLQYPGKTPEEIQQKIEKKLQRAEAMKGLTSSL